MVCSAGALQVRCGTFEMGSHSTLFGEEVREGEREGRRRQDEGEEEKRRGRKEEKSRARDEIYL